MEQVTNEQLHQELQALKALLSERNKYVGIDEKSVELWAMKDIAEYTKFTVRHIQSLVAAPYFPKPVMLPSQRDPNKPTDKPRWFAGEVVRYMRRRQLS
ncbi:hypothetical protein [Avibacterium paragallinarum]|uniref:Uncharacterized protein n=1 Tax=Avibacterium paragallinarum TaxID=728 RepID=A0AAE5TJT1_AVIPA|nr:hypothetical protein [Avibacterium paragallinarum]MEE3608151.1 hypothetical protein [Avibacterium paragallinarum]MEE3622175.1 hypothetical protein [Avibacterium paragallinarum]MEE3669280.1 hypothetical protein [Avibacterium paragallinarum]MEE3681406.1 hypothetical protein [Avibacterium paragallinarum]MEE4386716.1 hypothetical protein [Avibacterium paragallinarum]